MFSPLYIKLIHSLYPKKYYEKSIKTNNDNNKTSTLSNNNKFYRTLSLPNLTEKMDNLTLKESSSADNSIRKKQIRKSRLRLLRSRHFANKRMQNFYKIRESGNMD